MQSRKKNIKISVITATWNCADTLRDCINSIAAQDYPNLEHIVVDGASTDDTLQIINSFKHRIGSLISEPDCGIYDALNKGIRVATGDVVGFLHSDDYFPENTVLSKVAWAFSDPDVCAVYGDLNYVKRESPLRIVRRWRSGIFNKFDLNWGWMPAHPTLYVRRDWYSIIGGFDTSYSIAADYHSILKIFSRPGFKSVYIPEVLITMRIGGESNKTISSIFKKTCEDWKVLRWFGFTIPGAAVALFCKNARKINQFI
jgi:glycosyltransferase involved in cell wall biosynthesis